MAPRSSRKRRKERQRRSTGGGVSASVTTADAESAGEASNAERMARGYSRSRAKDEAARAALKPLAPGERPTAVTVGAIAAAALAVANLVALVLGYDPDEGRKTVSTALGTVILLIVTVGMWRARYWAVLGMQALLGITVILASLALLTAANLPAAALVVAIGGSAGTLFWFLIKAMARIQMPERPGAG